MTNGFGQSDGFAVSVFTFRDDAAEGLHCERERV